MAAFSNFPPTFFDFFLNAAKRLHSINEESVGATKGMAPDLPLEDVRRYLGKRKRVSEVPCKNIQSLSLF